MADEHLALDEHEVSGVMPRVVDPVPQLVLSDEPVGPFDPQKRQHLAL